MRDNYEYIDPDYSYTDPKTGVLKNFGGITNYNDLIKFESIAVTKRRNELKKHPIQIKNTNSLLEIHARLFQDVYKWAGKVRTVEISKMGKQFFLTPFFEKGFLYVDDLIIAYRKLKKDDTGEIALSLANILDSVNYLHPFREGNGRTQREFLRVLALEHGFDIDLNPPDNTDVYERYMSGTIDGDIPKLRDLLLELINSGPSFWTPPG